MYLIFDTETSNIPQKTVDLDHPCQARIMQLGCILLDKELKEVANLNTLFKIPEGTQIHPKAFEKHGITVDRCRQYGTDPEHALQLFCNMLNMATTIVGFNIDFDKSMLDMECYRIFENPTGWKDRREVCVMKASTNYVQLPFANGKQMYGQKYKWPKLEEAYAYFFHKVIKDQHGAFQDCKATSEIFVHLVENQLIEQ